MKKVVDVILVAAMLAAYVPAGADSFGSDTPPQPPAMQDGRQPGEAPDSFGGGFPGEPPEGMPEGMPEGIPGGMPGGMGGPGGGASQPESYDAVYALDSDTALSGETIESTGTDENAVLVTGGSISITDCTVTRNSSDSTGGDSASFYGVGAAVLTTGGTVTVSGSSITTDSAGGAGVFAYGDGTAVVSDTTIITFQGTSGGIHVAGGGTLKASGLTVETYGASSAAIRSDRGSGTMVVDGGSYTSHGAGSPAVYVTADIAIRDAELASTGSEALCLEGLNSVRLYNCTLSGSLPDDSQNDNTWTVILYQSMSGDAAVGQGSFVMDGGKLISGNGGLFYTTNTESVFTLRGVEIDAADDCEYFLRATGNSNQRGWGSAGANGADCTFTAIQQEMNGDILYDSISNLTVYLTEGSVLTGAVIDDESCAGSGGSGTAVLTIDASSTWVVTGDSTLTSLRCAGTLTDLSGNPVTVVDVNGTILAEGSSNVIVTVQDYSTEADISGAGTIADFSAYDIL